MAELMSSILEEVFKGRLLRQDQEYRIKHKKRWKIRKQNKNNRYTADNMVKYCAWCGYTWEKEVLGKRILKHSKNFIPLRGKKKQTCPECSIYIR